MREPDFFEIAKWDSEFFGFPVGKVLATTLSEAAVSALPGWAKENRIRCLYFLCDSEAESSFIAARALGFDLVDIRLTFRCDLAISETEIGGGHSGLHVDFFETFDPAVLEPMSRDAFSQSRFYSDFHFDRKRAGDLYTTWLAQDCQRGEPGAGVVVAKIDGKIAGYVTLRSLSRECAAIGLVCVGEEFRGKGVGDGMLAFLRKRLLATGAREIEVVTQGKNSAARKLYERHRYRLAKTQVWHHLWFDPGTKR